MAKFPTIEELTEQVIERVLEEILIDGEPLGKLIDSGDLVHIVRCKDCKFASSCYGDIVRCSKGGGEVHRPLGMNGYCSLAERKEE